MHCYLFFLYLFLSLLHNIYFVIHCCDPPVYDSVLLFSCLEFHLFFLCSIYSSWFSSLIYWYRFQFLLSSSLFLLCTALISSHYFILFYFILFYFILLYQWSVRSLSSLAVESDETAELVTKNIYSPFLK